jgi:DNA-binding transcriptional LysR family regulator
MQGVELRHMRCLVAIAEEGSFGRAALRLGTTQPAVSQLLKRLEDLAGHRLVNRDRFSLSLTPVGEDLLLQARQALSAVEDALDAAQRSLRGEAGRLRVGFSAASLYSVVPALIRRFRVDRPGIAVEMVVLNSQDQAAALLERRVDVAFGAVALRGEALAQRRVAEETTRLVLPRWHRLAGARSLPLHRLWDEAWILPPPETPVREDILLHCRAAGFTPRIAAESPDFLTTFGLVMADAGIALAAESFRDFAGPELALIPIEGDAPRLVHALTYRSNESSPAVLAFLEGCV